MSSSGSFKSGSGTALAVKAHLYLCGTDLPDDVSHHDVKAMYGSEVVLGRHCRRLVRKAGLVTGGNVAACRRIGRERRHLVAVSIRR